MKYPPVPQSMAARAKQRNAEANGVRKRPVPNLIVPGWIDDAGLTQAQFRVLCRIARRCGKGGRCFESHPSMARGCKMNEDTLKQAVKELLHRGYVRAEPREGDTTLYWIVTDTPPLDSPHPNEGMGSPPKQTPPLKSPTKE